MNCSDYIRPDTVSDAIKALATPAARVLAGGTNLVDLMKYDVEKPVCLVDINRLPLKEISATADGGMRIGALVSNSDLAWNKSGPARYPLLPSAILAGASPQLRNAATTGGNFAPTDAVLLLLRSVDGLQQARARCRLLRHRRREPDSRHSWR